MLLTDEKKQDNVDQTGWFLSAHRQQGSDKRNGHSTFVMIHKDGWQGKTWKILPLGNGQYTISLAIDEPKCDGTDQTGWFLSAHRYQGTDKRNGHSTYAMIHKPGWQANKWVIKPNK